MSFKYLLSITLFSLMLIGILNAKDAVFVPKHSGSNSLFSKAHKKMWYTATATEFRPIPDKRYPEKDFYSHRYHFLNFIKATTPYPTFRACAIRDNTGNFRDKLYEIIKAAHDTGFGEENILINLQPQASDFEENTSELTTLFKSRLEKLLKTFNGKTEFLGIKFKVKYWETGNELDCFEEGRRVYAPSVTDDQLFTYWQYVYTAIKKEIPDAVVLSNSFYYVGVRRHTNKRMVSYINHKYSNGKHLYDYFDIFNFHYYHYDLPPTEIAKMIENVRERTNKNVWITELGCGITDTDHAYRFPILNITASAYGVDRTLIYKMFNAIGTDGDKFSLISSFEYDDDNTTLKNVEGEGFYAAKFFSDICGQGSTRPVVSNHDGVNYAFWKSPNYGKVYAIWSDGGQKEIIIDCKNSVLSSMITYNYKGETINALKNGRLTINDSVLYLTKCPLLKVRNH